MKAAFLWHFIKDICQGGHEKKLTTPSGSENKFNPSFVPKKFQSPKFSQLPVSIKWTLPNISFKVNLSEMFIYIDFF